MRHPTIALAICLIFGCAYAATKEEIGCSKYLKLVAAIQNSSLDIPHSNLTVSRVLSEDERPAIALIRDAYVIWTSKGIYEFMNSKTDEQLIEEVRKFGFVVKDNSGTLVATFQLIPTDYPTPRRAGYYLERARAAVSSDFQRQGVMSSIRRLIETKAKILGYAALIIRVAEKTAWLYQWDLRSGFKPFDHFINRTSSGDDEIIWWMYKYLE